MLSPIQNAIAAIKSAPRSLNGGVYWMADPTLMAKVAVAIIGSGDTLAAMKEITDATGVNSPTMRLFIRGRDAQQKPCQVILDGLKAAGLMPVAYTPRHGGWYGRKSISAAGQSENQQSKESHPTAPETKVRLLTRLISEGTHEGIAYKVYINDETNNVRVTWYYNFESKEWCDLMSRLIRAKP